MSEARGPQEGPDATQSMRAAIVNELVCNGYEPPLFTRVDDPEPCQTCSTGRRDIEILTFGDGSCSGNWICETCARAIWRAARDQGRELDWQEQY